MAKKTAGELIREARNAAGMTRAELADRIAGLSASDIGKAERNEKELGREQLKAIARATGVTQKSLLEAPSGVAASGKKAGGAGTTGSSGSQGSGGGRKSGNSSFGKSGTEIQVTATERKLLELYRAADSDTKKAALVLLKNEKNQTGDILGSILGNKAIMNAISGFFTKEG